MAIIKITKKERELSKNLNYKVIKVLERSERFLLKNMIEYTAIPKQLFGILTI